MTRKRKWFPVSLAVGAAVIMMLIVYQGIVFGSALSQAQPSAGLDVTVKLSTPSNGSFLTAGETSEVTVTLKDKSGASLSRADFATLNLYAYGPQETVKTVAAVKLLNATTDRSKTPHHYIDLVTDAKVRVEGNTLKYTLQPVTDEEGGTYTLAVYAVKKGTPALDQQMFAIADFQLGTATVEKEIVEKEKCASCHQGAANGVFYLHHVDPGRSPFGSPSIDSVPVDTCKSCHNNEGYASFVLADGTRIVDQIVRRVHGVHVGEELQNPLNTDPDKGMFKLYRGVVFPADVRNCNACHVDDRWKTMPSRLACGTCHDVTWFGDAASMPATSKAHPGGPQANDATCAACHTPEGSSKMAISVAHDPAVNVEHDQAVVTLSPPANGQFYVAGERPAVTVVIKDAGGNPVDHTQVDRLFTNANFYVFGPREQSKPVLTTAARIGNSRTAASATSSIPASGTPAGWTFAEGDTFKIALNGEAPRVLNAPAGLQTPQQVVDWLKAELAGANVTVSGGTNVNIASRVQGEQSRIEIYNSPVTARMGWKPAGLDIIEHGKVVGKTVGTTMEPFVLAAAPSTIANTLRGTADPAVTRTAESITYQLDDVAGLQPGTYTAYMYTTSSVTTQNNWARSAFGSTEFQVGTATPEPKIAGNCAQCHGTTVMHLNERNVHPAQYDPDQCKACHDYQRFGTGDSFSRVGGTSTGGWAGFGAKPIVARIHGVHFGAYLNHKEQVYAGNPNMASEIIFPQDVRNCVKCHDPKGSSNWKEKPSRLACMSCHDSDQANAHAKVMTFFPNPSSGDTWSNDREESCVVCHGPNRELAVEKVHNISSPYKPPYPRE